jgi:type I restriction enzyme S subunit
MTVRKSPPPIDILPQHWEIVRAILQKHIAGYEVWAFGSRAGRRAQTYSDLDLAVITDTPLSRAVSAALAEAFSESDLPWKVDIVDWATTSEAFRKIIERDRVKVTRGSAAFRRRSGGASRADLKPFLASAPDVPPMPGDELP